MTTHTFAIRQARKLLATARKAAEPIQINTDEKWSISHSDPTNLLSAFPSLRLRPGLTLIAYEYYVGGDGNAVVYAYPDRTPIPEPAHCPPDRDHWLHPPRPEHAMDPMTAIKGDGRPISYLQASLLGRELAEFGARWHGCSWSTHELYGGEQLHGDWEWLQPRPGTYNPSLTITDAAVTVIFYTRSDLGQQTIYRHTDTFTPGGSYVYTADTIGMAVGAPGFIF